MLSSVFGTAAAIALGGVAGPPQSVCTPGYCEAPENSGGTVDLPGPCPFRPAEGGTIDLVGDLPAGTTIRGDFTVDSFFDIVYQAGGGLGGEIQQYRAFMNLHLTGTGKLAGFDRQIQIPLDMLTLSGPRPGGVVQTFPTEMVQLQGEIFGDPDFDTLRVTAGTGFGLPAPGQTTLTRLGGGTYNVDSFFDITYRVEFVGAPGSILEDSKGVDVSTVAVRNSDGFAGLPCAAPDNGLGTVDIPAPCPFIGLGTVRLTNGLPPDARIDGTFNIDSFFDVTYQVGGALGGQVASGQALATLELRGAGALKGFTRVIPMQLDLDIHTGPRTNGAAHQSFETEIVSMQGQLFGDPDFDTLRITAGAAHGLPSPGHATLARLDAEAFQVDSFFDITYEIDFQGAPGSILEGLDGTTPGTLRMHQGFGQNHRYADRFGLPHLPLGGACLDGTGGQLTISNIGSSGKDGVSIDLGGEGASGWSAEFALAPIGALPEAMRLWIDGYLPFLPPAGEVPGAPFKAFGVQLSPIKGNFAQIVFEPFVLGQVPVSVNYSAWLGGEFVGAVDVPGPIVPMLGNLGSSGQDGVIVSVDCDDDCDVVFEIHSPEPTQFITPTGPALADELRVCVTLPEGGFAAPFSHIDVRAAGLPQLTITDEALGMFCHDHRAIGAAHLAGRGRELVVSNIGSSGLDGVAIDLDGVTECDLCTCLPGWTLDFGAAGALPSGSAVHLQALLPTPTGPECVWCLDIDSSSDGRASVAADFSRLHPAAISVDLLLDGFVVDSVLHATPEVPGPLVISNIGSSGKDGVRIDVHESGADMSWTIRSPEPGPSNFPGLALVIADEIRITAHELDRDCGGIASGPVAPPAPRYEVIVENVPQLVILDERLVLPCTGDVNGDGHVNVVDLVRVILAWGKGDTTGDVNGDGRTDVIDLVEIILNWGPCQVD